jgi:hypothetical protein
MQSESHNLRYMGIDALGRIVKMNADFAGEHQLAVIDCLEDPDDTLKRKTLDLLYKMTKPNNVEVIVERMIAYMRTVTDTHGKGNIAGKVIELAERFAPTNEWFILVRTASDLLACRASTAPKQCLCSYVRVCNLRHRSTYLPMKRLCKSSVYSFQQTCHRVGGLRTMVAGSAAGVVVIPRTPLSFQNASEVDVGD